MLDLNTRLSTLRRNRLLTQTARNAMSNYNRCVHLPRILDLMDPPSPVPALLMLLDCEASLEHARKEKAGTYSVARHIEVLAAIMAETRLMRASQQVAAIK